MSEWAGFFISFEGVDGAGKSTQVAALAAALRSDGHEVLTVREPGETAVGEVIRGLLLRPAAAPLDPWAEALLFVAARAQLLAETVLPALMRGVVVIADRYVDSTLAYQGGGRGLDPRSLRALHRAACGDVWPDLTLLLDLPPGAADRRRRDSQLPLDRMELSPRPSTPPSTAPSASSPRPSPSGSWSSTRRGPRSWSPSGSGR